MKSFEIIDFLKEVEKFKTCERTCRTSNITRAESDAEHSWHLALFLMLLENELAGIDFTRLIKIALIHDLPEIYAGDTNPYRGDTGDKEKKEKRAAEELFSGLPDKLEDEFNALFTEYMAQDTLESRVVKSADKLMPLIQNLRTNDTYSSYRALNVTLGEVTEYMDQYFPDENILKDLYRKLLKEAHRSGVFSDREKTA